jgi:hypothetical protein
MSRKPPKYGRLSLLLFNYIKYIQIIMPALKLPFRGWGHPSPTGELEGAA